MSEFRDSRRDSSSYNYNDAAASSSALTIHDSTASANSISKAESSLLSSSNVKTPSRSFYHRAFHGSLGEFLVLGQIEEKLTAKDPAQYSSHGVREQSAELASLAISDADTGTSLDDIPQSLDLFRRNRHNSNNTDHNYDALQPGTIEEGSSSDSGSPTPTQLSSSALTAMICDPARSSFGNNNAVPLDTEISEEVAVEQDDERTSLLRRRTHSKDLSYGTAATDLEGQSVSYVQRRSPVQEAYSRAGTLFSVATHPKSWDRRAIWREGVVRPVSLLPAVFLGLLLNILDALSYGMILFPLGEAVFSDLGSDGISMFYVSTIISQLVFSSGASIFKGGIGSEMIEVVPFFHKMAFMILNRVGADNPKSVLATTILSFSISSVLTGLVFFLMGVCKLGSLIGFFPRHILIGCIGGVGWFLIATGVEVSARLPGSLEYNVPMLQKLFSLDTVFLWMIPLCLAIFLLVLKRFIKSNFLVGGYFILVGALFYVIKFIARIPMESLRGNGWVFQAPAASNPWWHFYSLYGKYLLHKSKLDLC
jgi:SulP family sulfate permease